jgi:hypothetical protein
VAEWTIDDNGDLEFTDADGRLWTLTAAMLGDLVWTAETGQAATAVAALVADVRAARRMDEEIALARGGPPRTPIIMTGPDGLYPGPEVEGHPTWYGPRCRVPDGWEARPNERGPWGPPGIWLPAAVVQARPVRALGCSARPREREERDP